MDRGSANAAFGWKMGGDLGCDLLEGEAVDPSADESPKVGVRIYPALNARPVRSTMFRWRGVARREAIKSISAGLC